MLRNLRALGRIVLLLLVILCLLATVLLLALIRRPDTPSRKLRVARVMQGHLKAMSWVCGLRVHVLGPRPPAGEPFLLLSNHVSYWDILALGSLFPLGFMAKDCIAAWPLLGTVTRLCNTIFVNREIVRARWRSLRSLQTEIRDLSYCVFPEGTTTAALAPKLSHWRRGNIAVLREPGAPVWLAGLHYEKHTEQAWIDDDALLPHLFRVMKAPRIGLTIQLQPFIMDPGVSLSQAAVSAWKQTTSLCQKAQHNWKSSPATRSVQLCKQEDSAVS